MRPGGQAVVKCDFGYSLKGSAIITCQDDASWSLPLPKCVKPKCTKPPGVEHGNVRVWYSLPTITLHFIPILRHLILNISYCVCQSVSLDYGHLSVRG